MGLSLSHLFKESDFSFSFQGRLCEAFSKKKASFGWNEKEIFFGSQRVPWNLLQGWEWHTPYLTLSWEAGERTRSVALEFSEEDFPIARRSFQLVRARRFFSEKSPPNSYIQCTHCGCLVYDDQAPVHYCSECCEMWTESGSLTLVKGAAFSFCEEGFFLQCFPEGPLEGVRRAQRGEARPSMQKKAHDLLMKSISHLLWFAFWLGACFLVSYLLPSTWTAKYGSIFWWLGAGFVALAFFHLFVGGAYHAALMMKKGLKSYLRPSIEEKILRDAKQGIEATETGYERFWRMHPGYYANLALANPQSSQSLLKKAIALCPGHPTLHCMLYLVSEGEEREQQLKQLTNLLQKNLFLPLSEIRKRVESMLLPLTLRD